MMTVRRIAQKRKGEIKDKLINSAERKTIQNKEEITQKRNENRIRM